MNDILAGDRQIVYGLSADRLAMVEGMTARTRTMEDWARLFNGRKPTDEEMHLVVNGIASDIEKMVDQGFIDEIDEMLERKRGESNS